jgi:hypothetical protein
MSQPTSSDGRVKGDGGENQPKAAPDSHAKLRALEYVARIAKAVATITEVIQHMFF